MSNTEFVMVPRDVLHDSVNGSEQEQGRARNKIRSLLEQPAEQHQGEPVAWDVAARIADIPGVHEALALFSEDPTGDAGTSLVREVLEASPADPGEVERLRKENENLRTGWYKDESDNNRFWPEEIQELRAQLATETSRADAAVGDANDAERKLAERDALLRLARQFVVNGVDLGYIQMPDADTPDPAHDLVPKIDAALSGSAEPSAPESFQQRVQPWLIECFGEVIAHDREERNHRFLEEALELVQSLGCTAESAHQLVDYVFGRAVGEPEQEVGGVMVTLAALCLANELDMHALADTELARVWTKVEQIREKQKSKPQVGPLPGVYPGREPTAPVERDERAAFDAWTVRQGRVVGYLGWREDFAIWQAALERKS